MKSGKTRGGLMAATPCTGSGRSRRFSPASATPPGSARTRTTGVPGPAWMAARSGDAGRRTAEAESAREVMRGAERGGVGRAAPERRYAMTPPDGLAYAVRLYLRVPRSLGVHPAPLRPLDPAEFLRDLLAVGHAAVHFACRLARQQQRGLGHEYRRL